MLYAILGFICILPWMLFDLSIITCFFVYRLIFDKNRKETCEFYSKSFKEIMKYAVWHFDFDKRDATLPLLMLGEALIVLITIGNLLSKAPSYSVDLTILTGCLSDIIISFIAFNFGGNIWGYIQMRGGNFAPIIHQIDNFRVIVNTSLGEK